MTITEIEIPGAVLYLTGIDTSMAQGRQTAERAATAALASHIFGSEATIEHRPDGAPFITTGGKVEPAHVSVSHCRGTAVLAVSTDGLPVGVDIELERPQLLRVAARFLNAAEAAAFNTLPLILRAWTAKEAIFKAAPRAAVDFARHITLLPTPAFDTQSFSLHSFEPFAKACITTAKPVPKPIL